MIAGGVPVGISTPLQACTVRLGYPSRGVWSGPNPAPGAGQFRIVTNGTGIARDHAGVSLEIGPMSCMFVEPTGDYGAIQASDSGIELVALQFPREDYFVARRPAGRRP